MHLAELRVPVLLAPLEVAAVAVVNALLPISG
jgi:hypothetical protein